MRIRSIKPEFWRSDDINNLSRENRLLFIGLWSYVDDNGVGVDDYRRIAADLFALEDDQKEVRDFVREGLATLSRALLVARFEVDGKGYIHIRSWKKHQKVDRPNKARYPEPPPDWKPPTCEDVPVREDVARVSRNVASSSLSGTEEQGNRGTGEKDSAPLRSAADRPGAQLEVIEGGHDIEARPTITAQDAVKAWHDGFRENHDAQPTKRQIGQAGREAKALLEAGNPPERVVYAAQSAGRRGLPTIEREYRDLAARAGRQQQRPSTTDQRVQGALALAQMYEERGE